MILTPFQKGAVGDGEADDTLPIMAMFSEAAASAGPVRIDMRGVFAVSASIDFTMPAWSVLQPGVLRYIGSEIIEDLVTLRCGSGCVIDGVLFLDCAPSGWSWRSNRRVNYGVNPHRFVGGMTIGGYFVRGTLRGAVAPRKDAAGDAYNVTAAGFGFVRSQFVGATGHPGHEDYTRLKLDVSSIAFDGIPGAAQRAVLYTQQAEELRVRDHVRIGSEICEVTGVAAGQLEVYPWPSTSEHIDDVDAVIGSGLELYGGNTGGVTFERIESHYTGSGLRVASASGVTGKSIMAEACGLGYVLGGVGSKVQASDIGVIHAEGCLYRYLTTHGMSLRSRVGAFVGSDLALWSDAYVLRGRKYDGSPIEPVELGVVTNA